MRRLIIGLASGAVILLVVVIAMGAWVGNRALRAVQYTPQSPPPPITVPQYPKPAENGFEALARAASSLEAEEDAIAEACDEAWDNPDAGRPVEAHATALQEASSALDGQCLQPRPSGVAATFPQLKDFRTLARLYILRGRLRAREGRHREATEAHMGALRLGPVASRNGCLTIHSNRYVVYYF